MQPYVIMQPPGGEQADEWVRLGIDAQVAGKLPDAQRMYQKALQITPQHPIATQNLAIVFAQSNLLNEALLTVERASMMDGVLGGIQVNWALMALEADHIDVALAAARRGMAMAPNIQTRMTLASILSTAGLPDQAVPIYREILAEDSKHPQAGPNACFVLTLTDATPKELLAQRKIWYAANAYTGPKAPHPNDKTLARPIRVGYVSGDFKHHSAAIIFQSVVLKHSDQIVPYFYSTLPVEPEQDGLTKRFQAVAGERWRNLVGLTDEQAEAMIRQDQIDILVDLAGHTNGGRLTLFTRKPAPIQVTGWGFAHGTGCPEIDYFLADPVAVKTEERQDYAETVVDLPCIVTYAPPTEWLLTFTSSLPYHRHGFITFGTFARYEKMSDTCLQTFADILRRVPNSTLQFKDHAYRRPYSIRRVLAAMPDIAKDRLLFSIATSHEDHMRSYQQADLILDPFPHGGGVVSLEQLYMGVPMVTRYGTQPAGRTAASALTAMGKTDWIAKDEKDYVEIAVRMANDIPFLSKIRKTLHDEFVASPVITGYTAQVEAAYRTMWETWCKK